MLLNHSLSPAISFPSESFTEARVYTNIPSTSFGIEQGRPGDIDLLFVPMSGQVAQVRNTAFAEVKIIRPTRNNPAKDHKDSGRQQILGLVNQGVPIISLIHIILPETNLTTFEQGYNLDTNEDLNAVFTKLSGIVNERQVGRLEHLELPDFVGYSAALLEVVGNVTMASLNHSLFCKHNPRYQPEVGELIQKFVDNTDALYVRLAGRPASEYSALDD